MKLLLCTRSAPISFHSMVMAAVVLLLADSPVCAAYAYTCVIPANASPRQSARDRYHRELLGHVRRLQHRYEREDHERYDPGYYQEVPEYLPSSVAVPAVPAQAQHVARGGECAARKTNGGMLDPFFDAINACRVARAARDRLIKEYCAHPCPAWPALRRASPEVEQHNIRSDTGRDELIESCDAEVMFIISYDDLPVDEQEQLRTYDCAVQEHELLELAALSAQRLDVLRNFRTLEDFKKLRKPAQQQVCERHQRRLDALEATRRNPRILEHARTSLSGQTRVLLDRLSVNYKLFEECTGTAIQQVLHSEYVSIIKRCSLQLREPESEENIREPLFTSLIRCACAGREASEHHLLGKSFAIADACWNVLEALAGEADGLMEGVANVGHRAVRIAGDPGAAAHEFAHGACALARLVCAAGFRAGLSVDMALHAGDTRQLKELGQELRDVAECICTRIAQTPLPELTRASTRFITELVIEQRLLTAIGPAMRGAARLAEALAEARQPMAVLEGAALVGARGIAAGAVAKGAAEAVPMLSRLGDLLTDKEEILRLFKQATAEARAACLGPVAGEVASKVPVSACVPCMHRMSRNLPASFACLQEQFEGVHKALRVGENLGRHLAFPDMYRKAQELMQATGWHLGIGECLDYIERLITIEGQSFKIEAQLVKCGKDGFALYEWRIPGITAWKQSSFFPAGWTPQHVHAKTFEALKKLDPRKVAFASSPKISRYKLLGFTQEGYCIEFYFEKGKLVSFYPHIQSMIFSVP